MPLTFLLLSNYTKTYHQSLDSWTVIVIFQQTFFHKSFKECYDGPIEWNLPIHLLFFVCLARPCLFVCCNQTTCNMAQLQATECRSFHKDWTIAQSIKKIVKRWKKERKIHTYLWVWHSWFNRFPRLCLRQNWLPNISWRVPHSEYLLIGDDWP